MSPPHVRVHVLVSGRVQGVWFRESTRECALRCGLTGWVRNLPDGRVEALFEGADEAVDEALAFVRSGPPHAQVTRVEIASRESVETTREAGFRVRRGG